MSAITISVICSTIGRPSLLELVESFMCQRREEEDRLVLFGDGWTGEGWIFPPEVRFQTKPKAGYWGHRWLVEGMRTCATTHYTFMGDDDVYLPRAFDEVRSRLGAKPLITSVMEPRNRHVIPWFEGTVLAHTKDRGRACVGGWQIWLPRNIQLVDFSGMSDAQAWRELEASGQPIEEAFDLCPVLFGGGRWSNEF